MVKPTVVYGGSSAIFKSISLCCGMWHLAFVTYIFKSRHFPSLLRAIAGSEPSFSSLKDFVFSKKKIPILDKDEHEWLSEYLIQGLQKCFH